MAILATINPASLPVTAGNAFTGNDIRTLAIDATADDTMTNWKFPDCNSKPNNRLTFPSTPMSDIWVHARVKRLISGFEIGFEFFGQISGYASSYNDYWGLQVTQWFASTMRDQSQESNQSFSGSFPAEGSDWFDLDIEMSTGKIYIDGKLEHDITGTFLLPSSTTGFQFRIEGGEMTEIVIATEDTRGWRVASEVPSSLVSGTFGGDIADIQTPGITEAGIGSGGAGTEAVLAVPTDATGYKVVGHNLSVVAETKGTPESPALGYYLGTEFLGFTEYNADTENTPVNFLNEAKQSDASKWTSADITNHEIKVVNAVQHHFSTVSLGSGNYGTAGAANFTQGGEWDGGDSIALKHEYSARKLTVACDADINRKWGTSDKIHVFYTRRDVSGQSEVNTVLTWDETNGGYRGGLSQSEFDAITGASQKLKLYIFPL